MKELNLEEQIYLCKYHDVDTSLNTTIGINATEAKEYIDKLKKSGLYEQYRNLRDEEYEKIIKKAKNKVKQRKYYISITLIEVKKNTNTLKSY